MMELLRGASSEKKADDIIGFLRQFAIVSMLNDRLAVIAARLTSVCESIDEHGYSIANCIKIASQCSGSRLSRTRSPYASPLTAAWCNRLASAEGHTVPPLQLA